MALSLCLMACSPSPIIKHECKVPEIPQAPEMAVVSFGSPSDTRLYCVDADNAKLLGINVEILRGHIRDLEEILRGMR